MKPGDMVCLKSTIYLAELFEVWGTFKRNGEISNEQTAIVLNSTIHRGVTGIRLLTSEGKIGWVYEGELRVVNETG